MRKTVNYTIQEYKGGRWLIDFCHTDGKGFSCIWCRVDAPSEDQIYLIYGESRKSCKLLKNIFPEQLAHDHIISWSNKGDTVFDPFLGSGTTDVEEVTDI
jgi:DNA modification methylase